MEKAKRIKRNRFIGKSRTVWMEEIRKKRVAKLRGQRDHTPEHKGTQAIH